MNAILKKDFDAAVAEPWSTETCLLAQTSLRLWGEADRIYDIIGASVKAKRAMDIFDDNHFTKADVDKMEPTKANKKALAKLRASLPIRFKL